METIIKIVLQNTEKRLKERILEYNSNAIDFKCEYKIKDNLIFMICYSKVVLEYGDVGIYRMSCTDIYDGEIFKDGNVIDYDKMYNVEYVVSKTKGYFNHYINKL
jgi:hypothetical protein